MQVCFTCSQHHTFPFHVYVTHQGVCSLLVPALQPVRHTFVTANPSIHFSPLRHKYIFPFFLLSRANLNSMEKRTHAPRAGRSPGPVISHLHFSHLADALIQSDSQRVQRQTEPECSHVGEHMQAEEERSGYVYLFRRSEFLWPFDLLISKLPSNLNLLQCMHQFGQPTLCLCNTQHPSLPFGSPFLTPILIFHEAILNPALWLSGGWKKR